MIALSFSFLFFFLSPFRALVDILRHQSSPVQPGERNNSNVLTTSTSDATLGRPPKNLYTPVIPTKDNRSESLEELARGMILGYCIIQK